MPVYHIYGFIHIYIDALFVLMCADLSDCVPLVVADTDSVVITSQSQ